jgi:hypothetical protein
MSHHEMAAYFLGALLVVGIGAAVVWFISNELRPTRSRQRRSDRRHSDSGRRRGSRSKRGESGGYRERDAAKLGIAPREDED